MFAHLNRLAVIVDLLDQLRHLLDAVLRRVKVMMVMMLLLLVMVLVLVLVRTGRFVGRLLFRLVRTVAEEEDRIQEGRFRVGSGSRGGRGCGSVQDPVDGSQSRVGRENVRRAGHRAG